MRHEELVVLREEVLSLWGLNGPLDPFEIGVMLRCRAKRERMLAAAWLLLHYDESLHNGTWPQVIRDYSNSRSGAFLRGMQENPGIHAAMISSRIEACGEDGQMAREYYRPDDPVQPSNNRCVNRALEYCATWRERRRSYRDWYRRQYARKVAES
jgi:hypothetical protein